MSVTILYEDAGTATAPTAEASGDDLWLGPAELVAASGWEIKPEGVCREEICVPVPADRAAQLVRDGAGGQWLNLAAFARYIEQPYARDDSGGAWAFAAPASERRTALLTLEAPDFTLTDLDGRAYTLSAFRGQKVLLALWASW
ncbi:MAG: redoxin domain-containing protein [Chloroflexi bacterium]|nr:redoxin domain-containing protein [Chloroflexota bacterium]